MRTIINPDDRDRVLDISEVYDALYKWISKITNEYGVLTKEEVLNLRDDIYDAHLIISQLSKICSEDLVRITYLESKIDEMEGALRRKPEQEV